MAATYTKLRDGSWGLRINAGQQVTAGQMVTVTKKSGDTKIEQVGRVLWSGDGITLATIASDGQSDSRSSSSRRRSACGCDCGCCSGPGTWCDATCNCRGGNIYDC